MIRFVHAPAASVGGLVFFTIGLVASASASATEGERQRTIWRGELVEYIERDGLAIAEGDIVLGTADEMRIAQNSVPKISQGIKLEALVNTNATLWLSGSSGVIEVPYMYEGGAQSEVDTAIASFNATFKGLIQWVPRESQPDYVAFNLVSANLGSCSSNVGRIGGRQQISGDPVCNSGALLHEMGHAVGLFHVQNDPAAAKYVDIHFDRISPRYRDASASRALSRSYSGYDYRSIMHYGRQGFYMTADVLTMSTRPAGIDIGILNGYSAADIDAIRRIYGVIPTATTVTTNPPGLHVRVDGQDVVTPAVFNWAIGSRHVLDVPAGLQTLGGYRFAFGRWSHDAGVAPVSASDWTVVAGRGYPGQPSSAPETTVLIANFVRLLAITTSVPSTSANGTLVVTAEDAAWQGTTNLFPNYTKFTFSAQPAANRHAAWAWSHGFGMTGGFGASTSGTMRISDGAASQSVGGSFISPPGILLDVDGPGVDRDVLATLTRPDGTDISVLLPYAYSAGGVGGYKVNVAAAQAAGTDVRFVLDGIDGLDDPFMNSVTVPAISEFKRVTVRVHKELRSVVQRNPTCGGSLSLSDAGPWHAYGLNLTAIATPNPGVTFAGWTGSATETNLVLNTTVGDAVPELVANFNLMAEPLAIGSITPSSLPGDGPWAIEIRGTGFTGATRVAVNGTAIVPELIDSHLLKVTLTGAHLSVTGKTSIYLYASLGGSCNVFSKGAALDALPSAAVTVTDYSDMWWAGPGENGWGMSITQHGKVQFGVLYVYDNGGKPVWYVLPGGSWNTSHTAYTGSLYLPTSSPFSAYDTNQFKANAPVGTATLTYLSFSTATLTYTINGVSGTKSLSRQAFGGGQPILQVNDLWWNPAENGWGVNIAQQGQTLFPVWYTYDAAGNDTWFVVPGGVWTGKSFTGDMYTTTGSPWLGSVYNPAALVATKVGTMKLDFSDANMATMTYTVNGLTQTKSIVRQPF